MHSSICVEVSLCIAHEALSLQRLTTVSYIGTQWNVLRLKSLLECYIWRDFLWVTFRQNQVCYTLLLYFHIFLIWSVTFAKLLHGVLYLERIGCRFFFWSVTFELGFIPSKPIVFLVLSRRLDVMYQTKRWQNFRVKNVFFLVIDHISSSERRIFYSRILNIWAFIIILCNLA